MVIGCSFVSRFKRYLKKLKLRSHEILLNKLFLNKTFQKECQTHLCCVYFYFRFSPNPEILNCSYCDVFSVHYITDGGREM